MVIITEQAIDIVLETKKIAALRQDIGAIASFIGLVRDNNEGQNIKSMRLEHYPGMTEKSIQQIINQAQQRWQIMDAQVVHRIGQLALGEVIVLVLVSSAHRHESFAACEFIMDFLKTQAPFWKHEQSQNGSSHWVSARAADESATDKWNE